ncbi:hypothetical protein [Actinoplanes sp. NBRC 101535]|uniref:hypothetical protein n=1 Tax=Actinoplanes sp. NBRC 101535 TaxID=3032196 RepID=UPI0024A2B149|nr:hypothetical protein [Actinoplanes sp. NBRC 101535]GLY05001.1 hypothetical protein Acsp01_53800 [Actinoplanes sp. NBRC 101535]
MNALKRWRIAVPLLFFSVTPLAATIIGAVAFWQDDSPARQAMTVFLAFMFALCAGIALHIGFDRKMQDPPWMRIGTIVVFIVLACGVSWVRDLV